MPRHAKATVLTVEDDPIVRADLRLILEDAGFHVCSEARDGLEAVEQARTHRPDLIVLDLGLPHLDGSEAARRILEERQVPIVAITGRSNLDGQRRAAHAGATTVVLKPFSERELVGTLQHALARSEEDDYHLRVLIEQMVSRNYSEREITQAVRQASRRSINRSEPAGWLRRRLRRGDASTGV